MIKFDSLNNLRIKILKGKTTLNFEKQFNETLNKLKSRAELEMLDNGYYRTINEHLQNTDKNLHCRSLAMTILQDEKDYSQHILEISILHPTMMVENKRPLVAGHKNDILKYLNNPNITEEIKTNLAQMSEKLKAY